MKGANWHCMSVDEILDRSHASRDGLSQAEAQAGLLQHGANGIEEKPQRSIFVLLVNQLSDFPRPQCSGTAKSSSSHQGM